MFLLLTLISFIFFIIEKKRTESYSSSIVVNEFTILLRNWKLETAKSSEHNIRIVNIWLKVTAKTLLSQEHCGFRNHRTNNDIFVGAKANY